MYHGPHNVLLTPSTITLQKTDKKTDRKVQRGAHRNKNTQIVLQDAHVREEMENKQVTVVTDDTKNTLAEPSWPWMLHCLHLRSGIKEHPPGGKQRALTRKREDGGALLKFTLNVIDGKIQTGTCLKATF